MKRFFDLNGTPEQAKAVTEFFPRHYGGRTMIFSPQEAAGIPERLQEAMLHHGIIGFIHSCPGGLSCEDPGRTAHLIYGGTQSVHTDVSDSFNGLGLAILKANQMGSHPIHNMGVLNLYLDLFKKETGAYPKSVFEAGFGHDHIGQLFCCAFRGITFNGITPETHPLVDSAIANSILRSLFFRFDIDSFSGDVRYKTKLEDYRTDRRYELIYSHVVYEHVENVDSFTKAIFNVLDDKGLFITTVDLTGHSFGKAECSFLYLSDDEWKAVVSSRDGTGHVVNRMRHCDYVALFERVGFSVKHEIISRMDIPPDLQAKYQDVDLSPRMVKYVLSKKG